MMAAVRDKIDVLRDFNIKKNVKKLIREILENLIAAYDNLILYSFSFSLSDDDSYYFLEEDNVIVINNGDIGVVLDKRRCPNEKEVFLFEILKVTSNFSYRKEIAKQLLDRIADLRTLTNMTYAIVRNEEAFIFDTGTSPLRIPSEKEFYLKLKELEKELQELKKNFKKEYVKKKLENKINEEFLLNYYDKENKLRTLMFCLCISNWILNSPIFRTYEF